MARGGPLPPAYQVDFTAAASGKRIGATKRRIRWRFGFANAESLASGLTGVDCRGAEHEVVLVWSVTSGKRQVIVDGREVHHSVSPGGKVNGKFDYCFPFLGPNVMQVVAHATAPMGTAPSGLPQRQFDLFLNGQSYFEFLRLFELGLRSQVAPPPMTLPGTAVATAAAAAVVSPQGAARADYSHYSNYAMDDSAVSYGGERTSRSFRRYDSHQPEYYAHDDVQGFARKPADLRVAQTPTHLEAPPACVTPSAAMAPREPDLVDLVSEAAHQAAPPPPVYATMAPNPVDAQGFPAPAMAPTHVSVPPPAAAAYPPGPFSPARSVDSAPSFAVPPAQVHGFGSGYQPGHVTAPPAPSPVNGFDPTYQSAEHIGEYKFQQVSHDIMTKYGEGTAAPQPLALTNSPYNPDEVNDAPADLTSSPDADVSPHAAVPLTMAPVDPFANDREEDDNLDELTKAMKNLVNVNDISSAPEKEMEKTKLTMTPDSTTGTENVVRDKTGKIVRSKGLEPTAGHWTAGPQPSLGEMKNYRQHATAPMAHNAVQPPTEIMRAPPTSSFHPSAVSAGALVVYGQDQQSMQGGGPPPIEKPNGFGVGSGFGAGQYYAQQAATAAGYYAPQAQYVRY